jgi:predicted NodU family carbamoyl transferase
MKVLGFNCNVFNSAAALVVDGRVVAAAQEERFTRRRHTGEFPEHAIRYCLAEAGLALDDLDAVTFHWRPFPVGRVSPIAPRLSFFVHSGQNARSSCDLPASPG